SEKHRSHDWYQASASRLSSVRCLEKESVSMVQIRLQELITAHTDTLAHHSEEFVLLIRLLRLLGEETSVSPEHLATATHHAREEIEAFLQSTDLVVCRDGTIDLSPDPHLIQLEKKTLTGACALDTLV